MQMDSAGRGQSRQCCRQEIRLYTLGLPLLQLSVFMDAERRLDHHFKDELFDQFCRNWLSYSIFLRSKMPRHFQDELFDGSRTFS